MSEIERIRNDAALARLRRAHAPRPYDFPTSQTYCPAADGPTDQCDVCVVVNHVMNEEREQ